MKETKFAELKNLIEKGLIYFPTFAATPRIEAVDEDWMAEKLLASSIPNVIQYLRIIDLAKSVYSHGVFSYSKLLNHIAHTISCGAKSVDDVEEWLFERLRHPDG